MYLRKISTFCFVLLLSFTFSAFGNTSELEDKLELKVIRGNANTVTLEATITALPGATKRMTIKNGSNMLKGAGKSDEELVIPQNGIIKRNLEFEVGEYNKHYQILIQLEDDCSECGNLEEFIFYLCVLENQSGLEPVVFSEGEFYEALINTKLSEKLGMLVSESRKKEGVKGLFNFREQGLKLDEARKFHDDFFGGTYKPTGINERVKTKKTSDRRTQLASTYQKSGRVTYYCTKSHNTYGVPRAEVAVVLYYSPAWEETWAYGVTDDDGYYNLTFTIPDGQSLVENMVGIQVYAENETDSLRVVHPTLGLYMGETILSYSYNWDIDTLATFYGPARLQWAITQSFAMASDAGFKGGYADVIAPTAADEYKMSYQPYQVRLKIAGTQYGYLNILSHEHGHHLMYHTSAYLSGLPSWGLCGTYEVLSNVWGEAWAEFWEIVVTKEYESLGFSCYTSDIDSNATFYCNHHAKTDSIPRYLIAALWDLYDSDGYDEAYSFWSNMDDAFVAGAWGGIYGYIDELKSYYSYADQVIIENIIQMNLPPSPGALLATSELENVSLPKAFDLAQNYPNPFNPSTSISIALPSDQKNVDISIYNVRGSLVKRLFQGEKSAGSYTFYWDGKDTNGKKVASGVYFFRLITDDYSSTRKMVVLK